MNMTLRQIRAFHEVARARSFTLAARRMHLTQSAVSMLVRQLEEAFGLRLFDRVGRRVHLTQAGQEMLPVTARILDDMAQVAEGAADLRALRRGRLRLAVPQMLAGAWLPERLGAFRADHPEVMIDVIDTTGDRIVQAVAASEAEIGIGPRRPLPQGIAAETLWSEPIQLVVAADRAPRPSCWEEALAEEWILYSDDFSLHLEQTIWTPLKMRMPRMTRVRYLSTALGLIGRGLGVTAAPRYAAGFGTTFGVSFLDMTGPAVARDFMLYTREDYELSPAARAFCATLLRP